MVKADPPFPLYLYMAAKEECVSRRIAFFRKRVAPYDASTLHKRFSSTALLNRGILLVALEIWMDSKKELLDVHEDFPNPQRVGCPGQKALLELSKGPADVQLSELLTHVRQCAPCFDELRALRRQRP